MDSNFPICPFLGECPHSKEYDRVLTYCFGYPSGCKFYKERNGKITLEAHVDGIGARGKEQNIAKESIIYP